MDDLKYYKLLSEQYPNSIEAGKEIMLLEALLNLPKGPEIFLSDIHGEHEPFLHVLKNGSGIIKDKIKTLFGDQLLELETNQLASIIYYPREKLDLLLSDEAYPEKFYEQTLYRLVKISRSFAKIYTNRKLLRLLPKTYADIISELVAERELGEDNDYYSQLIQSIIDLDQCDQLIISFAHFIQRLAVHKIHIIGDIYDRGPGADIIVDKLIEYHSVDIQWGNHDIVWMGAACGSRACIANVLRLSLRYANTDTLENGYGINLVALASFALEHYKEDKSLIFSPKVAPDELLNQSEEWLNRLMHKAITIIQFKLEGQLMRRRPELHLEDRLLLDKVDLEKGTVSIDGVDHEMKDVFLPTLKSETPYELTDQEEQLMQGLVKSFLESSRLQEHVAFLYENGGLYKVSNNGLLYHGCIPLTDNGELKEVDLGAGKLSGKQLLDYLDGIARNAFVGKLGSKSKLFGEDMMWYLWAGPNSPIFGKNKMATFERYFLSDEEVQEEVMDAYYSYRDDASACRMILREFGLSDETSVIINGHVPVEVKKGESPIKAEGKLIVIDGGFSKAYQGQTGIAGYSLIFDSFGRQLIAHEPFDSTQKAIEEELDIAYSETVLHQSESQLKVRQLDDGVKIKEKIKDLKNLILQFQSGRLKERSAQQRWY